MKSPALWQISVATTPAAEPAMSHRLQSLFGPVVASYDDLETGVCTVSAFVEEERLGEVRSELRDALIEDDPQARVSLKKLRREDWAESWKRHFKPLQIGSRLLVKPSWSKRQPRHGQAVVVLDPGLSFGTGQHPTTSFCLQQVAAFRRPGTAQSCLDIGTGSGILAIAATKLGYAPVQAYDFDPEAVRVARQNARSNGVGQTIRISQEDVTETPSRGGRKFDLVCANLLADLLVKALPQITARVAPGGRLVIAGILLREFAEVRRAYETAGWRLVASRAKNEWQSGTFEAVVARASSL